MNEEKGDSTTRFFDLFKKKDETKKALVISQKEA